jgi:hypothetical protein
MTIFVFLVIRHVTKRLHSYDNESASFHCISCEKVKVNKIILFLLATINIMNMFHHPHMYPPTKDSLQYGFSFLLLRDAAAGFELPCSFPQSAADQTVRCHKMEDSWSDH